MITNFHFSWYLLRFGIYINDVLIGDNLQGTYHENIKDKNEENKNMGFKNRKTDFLEREEE